MAFSDLAKPDAPKSGYVLGIDIGGTTIKYRLFEYNDGALIPAAGYEEDKKRDTERGLERHTTQIASIISEVAGDIESRGGRLASVGIGSPGRFRDDGTIKPGTNPNLENPDLKDFDNVNLRSAYAYKLPVNLKYLATDANSLVVRNDGDAALLGITSMIKKGTVKGLTDQHNASFGFEDTKGNHVAYIGIGTGIGHAIMYVDHNGTTQFKTDGHASKLWVDVTAEDLEKVVRAKDSWNAMHPKPDDKIDIVVDRSNNRVRAEDLLRFPIICGMAEVADGKELKDNNPKHADAIRFSGKYMARLIDIIRSGKSEDVNGAEQGWNAADKQQAARSSDYIIGGGILKDKALADILIGETHK